MAEVETPCITILAPNSLWFFWLRGTRCDGDSSIYQSDPVRRRARSDPCSPNHYLDWTRRKIHLFLSTDGWTKVDRLVPPPRSRLWLASLRHRTPLNPSARLSVQNVDRHSRETKKEGNPLQEEDDYYSEGDSDYDSYSEDDPDEPITESDAENDGQLRRRKGRDRRNVDYYDDDEDEDEDDYSDEYDDDDDYDDDDAVAPYGGNAMQGQQGQQGGGKMELASDAKKGIDDEEGLKLKLEVNLDVEIELKAAIHGDLTLSLLA